MTKSEVSEVGTYTEISVRSSCGHELQAATSSWTQYDSRARLPCDVRWRAARW